jgi:hypothetical protein
MPKYEYGRINMLHEKLTEAQVDSNVISKIMKDGETVRKHSSSEKKAQWMHNAMQRMDKHLSKEVRYIVRENCACCLGGQRKKISEKIARENETFEKRINAANDSKLVFGHSVTRTNDGKIIVCFYPEGLEKYRCVCLPKAKKPISITYCYCCGGHVKNHLQTATGKKLYCKVVHSSLSSGGKKPCTFEFEIINDSIK